MATPMPFVPDEEQVESARKLEQFAKRPPKKKTRTVGPSKWDKALAYARAAIASGD